MLNDLFKLQIKTPKRLFYDGEIKSAIIPTTNGFIEILPNHAPLISTVEEGIFKIIDADSTKLSINIKSGLVNVKNNLVTVVTEKVEELTE